MDDSIAKETKDNALGAIMQLKQYFHRIRMTPTLKAEIKHRFDDKSKSVYSIGASTKDDAISPDRALSELNDSFAGLYGFPLDTSNEADILFVVYKSYKKQKYTFPLSQNLAVESVEKVEK